MAKSALSNVLQLGAIVLIVLLFLDLMLPSRRPAVAANDPEFIAHDKCVTALRSATGGEIDAAPHVQRYSRGAEYYFAWAGSNAIRSTGGRAITASCILNRVTGKAQLTVRAQDMGEWSVGTF